MYGLSRLKSAVAAANSRRLLSSPAATAGIARTTDLRNKYERKRRMIKVLKNVVTLTCESAADGGACDVYVIGSDHGCHKSWVEVKAVMQFVKPEAVFLELCTTRRHILTPDKTEMTLQDMVHMWKKNESLYSILYKRYAAKVFSIVKYDDVLGGDMRAAYIEATKYGAKVILGDVPAEISFLRYWANTSLWKLYLNLGTPVTVPADLVEKLKEGERTGKVYVETLKRLNWELTKQDPIGSKIFIHERDQYMSFKLLEVARQHKSVVAVVGRGHVLGIQNNWKQHVEVEQLLNIPLRTKMLRIAARVAQVACIYGAYLCFEKVV